MHCLLETQYVSIEVDNFSRIIFIVEKKFVSSDFAFVFLTSNHYSIQIPTHQTLKFLPIMILYYGFQTAVSGPICSLSLYVKNITKSHNG